MTVNDMANKDRKPPQRPSEPPKGSLEQDIKTILAENFQIEGAIIKIFQPDQATQSILQAIEARVPKKREYGLRDWPEVVKQIQAENRIIDDIRAAIGGNTDE